ncbi:MAG: Crp/Fnr family transcriptional regulator [Anaerolineae bacterium]|nr:Crp/Fnr family transcriptional regulator [Anaerolineae bacterium]MDW8102715.1 Crp/Fnr family transcriptional regulator [Anaerolineae bacterium]
MAIIPDKIRMFPIFSGLEERTLQRLASLIIESSAHAGKIIFLQGEEARYVYIVGRGIIRTRRVSPEGKEITIDYVGPGRIIDPFSAADGNPYTITADALTNAALYAIGTEEFRRMVEEDRKLCVNLLKELSGRARRLTEMVEEMALHTVRTRLARFLLQQSRHSDQYRPWTQTEIASQIGTVREIVGRILRDFASQGLITRLGGRIVIVDRDRLMEIAQLEGLEKEGWNGNRST